ncbi:unnamed protein product [Meloidogyne enterolobii]|uniref:Uncharacterized protein n=1 Tax=Meloidogyne enterolobii TaxID=390850 RepID=A0ACB0ZFU6_MELEN
MTPLEFIYILFYNNICEQIRVLKIIKNNLYPLYQPEQSFLYKNFLNVQFSEFLFPLYSLKTKKV